MKDGDIKIISNDKYNKIKMYITHVNFDTIIIITIIIRQQIYLMHAS